MPAESTSDDGPPPLHVRWDSELKRLAGMASSAEDKSVSEYVRDLIREDAAKKGIELPEND